jgi:hypothetical protein
MGRFSIIKKKEIWTTTWLGKLIIVLILFLILFIFTKNIHPFLAEVNPIETKTMILEGYVPDYVVEKAFEIFLEENYERMIITGKKRIVGAHLDMYKNDGEYTAATLRKIGMDSSLMVVVPVDFTITKDRTYESGIAVKNYLKLHPDIKSANLVSLGCHARRSRYLYEMSFNATFKIGVIAVQGLNYDENQWWRSSNGFRHVIDETIAWIYARFLFYP